MNEDISRTFGEVFVILNPATDVNHAGDDERGRRNHVFENLKALPWPSTFNASTSKTEIFPSQSHRYVVPKRDKRGDGDGVALSTSNTYNPRPMALPQFLRPAVELEREPANWYRDNRTLFPLDE